MVLVAGCGLAVGMAMVSVRKAQQPEAAEPAAPTGVERPGGAGEGVGEGRRPSAPPPIENDDVPRTRSGLLPAAVQRSAAGAGMAAKAPKVSTAPLPPLECFDARRMGDTSACSDAALRDAVTVDWRWQETIARYMRSYPVIASSFVAVDARTGEVRVMLSHEPGLEDTSDEALSARAPAASIFKIVSAVALLRRGVKTATRTCFHGGARGLTKELMKDNPGRDTSCEAFMTSFAQSRNTVFGRLAFRKLRQRHLRRAALAFGFNAELPFPFPVEESRADIPRPRFALAETAAGFSNVTLSPLHAALMAATVANGGSFALPTLHPARKDVVATEVLDKATAKALRTMMRATVKRGTGRASLKGAELKSAAKSGTLSAYRAGRRRHHTWMVGYAPAGRPRYAFAALVVNGETWHIKAGDLARFAVDASAGDR